jgi:hypothetical protein
LQGGVLAGDCAAELSQRFFEQRRRQRDATRASITATMGKLSDAPATMGARYINQLLPALDGNGYYLDEPRQALQQQGGAAWNQPGR